MTDQSYVPKTNAAVGDMLNAFAASIPGALAAKYGVADDEIRGVVQAQSV